MSFKILGVTQFWAIANIQIKNLNERIFYSGVGVRIGLGCLGTLNFSQAKHARQLLVILFEQTFV